MRLAVVGVGLIGGSIGLAARRRAGGNSTIHVSGYDRHASVLSAALEAGAIDEAIHTVAEAVSGVDTVFVAAPVGALPELIGEVLRFCGPDCLVTDVGSTKRAVTGAIDDPRFIGGHPLAGAETAGVWNAREDLFDGASWYLTPSASAPHEQLERLQRLITAFGAHPVTIDASVHDRLMARVSHLPHVFANVLIASAAGSLRALEDPSRSALLGAGPSFRDATRVAGANTAIWTDIYLSNSDALVEAVDEAIERLRQVREMLAGADASALSAWNEHIRAEREQLNQSNGSGLETGPAQGS